MLQISESGKVREGSGKGNGKVETVSETIFNKTRSPGRFREGKREGRNRLVKTPQSGKVREGSGKVTGKGKRTVQTTFLGVSVRYFQKRYQKGPETLERCKYH